ncbi:MAG: toxin-antitoxin system HicB family antitoxin [bacterium]
MLAQNEGVSLSQYIIFALTRQATVSYTVRPVPKKEIARQKKNFAALLENLGQASWAEIEQTMQEREEVAPEAGLTPEIVQRLQEKIEKQQSVSLDNS